MDWDRNSIKGETEREICRDEERERKGNLREREMEERERWIERGGIKDVDNLREIE